MLLRWQSMIKHKSRLEVEKEAAMARQASAAAGPADQQPGRPVPGYMRATAASVAMQRVCHTRHPVR